jgi:hypothetical protein
MKFYWIIVGAVVALTSTITWADAPKIDLIPELKDIEKLAAEQETAIRAQSEALKKAQQEKELAEKAAKEAIDKQKAASLSPLPTEQPVVAKPERKVATANNKTSAQKAKKPTPAPVDPWLAQERRYTYP